MLPIRPLVETTAGAFAVSWASLGASITLVQNVLGPDAALDIGLVVNAGLLIGGAVAIFHAGSTFRQWLNALQASEEERRASRVLEARMATVEKLLSQLLAIQGIKPPEDPDG